MFAAGQVDAAREFDQHSATSFGAWVEPAIPAMLRLAARLGRVEECQDIVQEALQTAWAKR